MPPCQECDVFSDGFESGALVAWDGSSASVGCSVAVENNVAHHGKYSCEFFNDGNNIGDTTQIWKNITGTEIYHKFHVRWNALPPNTTDWVMAADLQAFGGGGTSQLGAVEIFNDLNLIQFRLRYYTQAAGDQLIETTKEVFTNTWYCVVLHVKIDDATGKAELFIDGTLEATTGNIDNNDANSNLGFFRTYMGIIDGTRDFEFTSYIDCVCIDDDCRPACALGIFTPPLCTTLNISEWDILLELSCDGVPSQGETFRVTATIVDLDGNPVTGGAATHSICLYNPSGNLVGACEVAPTEVGSGVWYQNFNLAAAAPIGGWRVFWTVTLVGIVGIAKLPLWVSDP